MLVRIITSLVGLPLLYITVSKGSILLKIAVFILASIAINEFFNAFHHIQIRPYKQIGAFSILLFFFITILSPTLEKIMFWFFITVVTTLVLTIFKKKADIIAASITILGVFYIVFFMFHIVFFDELIEPRNLIWMIFITAWSTDTFAYFSGYFFGSRKLCPNISPKKTVEGAIGGIIGCVVVSGVFAYFVVPSFLYQCVIMGFFASILSQVGDLTASIIKRYVGIKDYGKIMPGHGGILDRFDSILFTAPIVFYLSVFLINS
ncbi:MAG: phosphatidate cytidylyltransferase [Bacillota bacterium]